MERLLQDGVVDRVVYAPTDPEVIRSTYRKWFDAESVETHSANGQQLFATLFGFDSCTGDYVMQLDSDLLITRTDWDHDYLVEMADVLHRDPKALFVPLSVCQTETAPYTAEGPDGNWRVEVRGCLYDRQRLQSLLPVSNELENGQFALAWHRAFDRLIAASDYRAYRGGSPKISFIHVPNDRKAEVDEWLDIVGAVERGYVPEVQLGKAELTGSAKDWTGPQRNEPFVFVICGHNVAHRTVQTMFPIHDISARCRMGSGGGGRCIHQRVRRLRQDATGRPREPDDANSQRKTARHSLQHLEIRHTGLR